MNYGFWYDVAEYGNKAWKGKMSQKEVACAAYEYDFDWRESLGSCTVTCGLNILMSNLKEDVDNGSEEAKQFLDIINEVVDYYSLAREV